LIIIPDLRLIGAWGIFFGVSFSATLNLMTSQELIDKYINFFKKRGHKLLPNLPLVPENDPTTLFISAGMQPLVPYLLGEPHPLGRRLVSLQRCLRTGDIDEVGDTTHLTFFEMLGNWSLGDPEKPDGIGTGYFKKEALAWSWEFVTQELGLEPNRLSVTIFKGDNLIPYDYESEEAWLSLGVPRDRIYALGREDNWWEGGGLNAPGGPDSEIFYDTGKPPCSPDCRPSCPNNCGKYFEIWNNVFMAYQKKSQIPNPKSQINPKLQSENMNKIEYTELPQKNVDTGMGVERTIAVLSGLDDNYQSEVFAPMIRIIEAIFKKDYQGFQKPMRIIADHLRSAVFLIADGVKPSNVEQGYVLRRLIRRAVRSAKEIGLKKDQIFTLQVAAAVVDKFAGRYPRLLEQREMINKTLIDEETRFAKTLDRGLLEFDKIAVSAINNHSDISGAKSFYLYESFGFPVELTAELAREKGLTVDSAAFDEETRKHQELSRLSAAGKFTSGLADQSEQVIKYHTATHLLHQALRTILGNSVSQKGSNITSERLRFDFSYQQKLTNEELQKVEDLVNQKIRDDLPVVVEIKPFDEAQKSGALAFFGEKYPKDVKVYSIGSFSKEVCNGPHVERTGFLGKFKIIKEESVSQGVRRIRAILT